MPSAPLRRPLWIACLVVLLAGAFALERQLGSAVSTGSGTEARAAKLVTPPRRLLRATSAARTGWLTTWAASPQPMSWPGGAGRPAMTVRDIVTVSAGGRAVRVRLTNAFGRTPLSVARAAVGRVAGGAAVAAPTPLTFRGNRAVTLPPGADVVSDAADLEVPPLGHLAVSLTVRRPGTAVTGHRSAQQTSFTGPGDHALDPGGERLTTTTTSWLFLDGVDVLHTHGDPGTVVAFGDSITDGVDSGVGADARWPDALARRLHAAGRTATGVVDAGIAGNRVLHDVACCGVAGVDRFGMDVLTAGAARDVIVLEGTNDIGYGSGSTGPRVSAAQLVAGYRVLIAAAHRAGLRILGGTLLPFGGAGYWTSGGEATRRAVNHWILTAGAFDGVVDFARAMADPGRPWRLRPAYDSGDHLHPNATGYRAMAAAVDLDALAGGR